MAGPYNIVFYLSARKLGNTPWDGNFEKAKQHATDHMKIQKADRVEIYDDNGGLVFQLPRVVSKAP